MGYDVAERHDKERNELVVAPVHENDALVWGRKQPGRTFNVRLSS